MTTDIAPRQLPDRLLATGRSTFSIDDAVRMLDRSHGATLRALSRLRQGGQVFSPSRGFYVVIPPEYRSWGAVPADHFIDDMMTSMGRAYYVALLSAAELHGAAHQRPQVFQVMCDPPLRDRSFARVRLRFYGGDHVPRAPTETRNVPTGVVRVASRELTVVDLIDLPGESGGISNVATVLREIGALRGDELARLAQPRGRSLVRRTGWIVERFGDCDDLEPLRRVAQLDRGDPVLLRPGAPRRGPADRRWGVRVNTKIEPDV